MKKITFALMSELSKKIQFNKHFEDAIVGIKDMDNNCFVVWTKNHHLPFMKKFKGIPIEVRPMSEVFKRGL